MKRILLIDDEDKLRLLLARVIAGEGYEVYQAADARSGLQMIENQEIDIVLSDVRLPDGNGVELVKTIKSMRPAIEVIIMTAFGKIADGIQAMKNGAVDYIVKGDDNDKILPLLAKTAERSQLNQKVKRLESLVTRKFSFDSIIGISRPFRDALALAQKVAGTDAAVLLTGETGTGKEVFAQAIHYGSARADKHFVSLNCSALGREIIESELFGYKQGAFTGALRDKKGLLEEANGGTLFLDEIGELPLDMQAKLLRVLETREFIKLGDTKTSRSDFRLIAATNRDLKVEAAQERFRSDLYFRLNVFEIRLPALRERKEDLPLLVDHFLDHFCAQTNKKNTGYSPGFLKTVQSYEWLGNIRQLKNAIERAVIIGDGKLTSESLSLDIQNYRSYRNPQLSAFSMASVEKLHIQKVLNYCKGNKSETAKLLEIGIATLYRKIQEYRITPDSG